MSEPADFDRSSQQSGHLDGSGRVLVLRSRAGWEYVEVPTSQGRVDYKLIQNLVGGYFVRINPWFASPVARNLAGPFEFYANDEGRIQALPISAYVHAPLVPSSDDGILPIFGPIVATRTEVDEEEVGHLIPLIKGDLARIKALPVWVNNSFV